MKSQTASLVPTENSASLSTRVAEENPTSTAPGKVIFRDFSVEPKLKAPPGAVDIDDLVAEFEQSAEGADAVAQGRKWVARTFYKNQFPTVAKLRLQNGWSQAELARAWTRVSHILRG